MSALFHARPVRSWLPYKDTDDREDIEPGELLRDMPKASGAKGVGPIAVAPSDRNTTPTYAEQGIDKRVAARCPTCDVRLFVDDGDGLLPCHLCRTFWTWEGAVLRAVVMPELDFSNPPWRRA